MSLEDCIATALQRNPDARSSDAAVDAAGASRAGVRGGFGPKLHADALVQEWNSAFQIAFNPTTPPIQVRDQFTWNASVTLSQPLTQIFGIYDQYKVEDIGVDVAAIQRDVTKRDVAFQVAQAYFQLLEAERLAVVAATSVTQLEAQARLAQSQLTNGVIAKNDELRSELALANARQRALSANGDVTVARGQLATLMAMPLETPIEPIPYGDTVPNLDEPTLESAEAHAATQRLELRALDRQIDQAVASKHAAEQRLVPNVSAIGSYQHVEGSAFQQTNAAFVGLSGSWDIWDWGTTISGITAADARRRQAEIAHQKVEDAVKEEARQAFVRAEVARQALDVARQAVTQAEENYRIVSKRFENAQGTAFDMVDAESLLTQARAQVETALYGYVIARMALQRATGASAPRAR
jgi:outer membrane protein TolC